MAANPQFAFRGFYEDYAWDGPTVRRPGHPARMTGTPPPPLRPPEPTPVAVEELVAGWGAERGPGAGAAALAGRKPLEGLTIVDFTWVLAGPFATRMLGDLGADVLKFQTEERATQVNKDDYPYYYCWNRSKRSAMLNMKHPDALGVIRRVIEKADVLIENYAAGVLARWGLGWDQIHAVEPAARVHDHVGLRPRRPLEERDLLRADHPCVVRAHVPDQPARPPDVGPGFSLNDHAAGLVAATLVLEAIEARERTGEGQLIDMAQLEVGSFSIGPALLDHFANGKRARAERQRRRLHRPRPQRDLRGRRRRVAGGVGARPTPSGRGWRAAIGRDRPRRRRRPGRGRGPSGAPGGGRCRAWPPGRAGALGRRRRGDAAGRRGRRRRGAGRAR